MENKLPKGWVKTRVGDISQIVRGVTYKRTDASKNKFEKSCLVLRGGNIQNGRILIEQGDDVFIADNLVKTEQKLKKGDVIIVGSTGSKKLIGKAAHSTENNTTISFGAFLIMIRPLPLFEITFFDYFFQSSSYRQKIRLLAGGININNIRRGYLEELNFPLPPLPEQKRIVAKLDTLFAHLEKLQTELDRIPQLLKDFRQSALTQAVTGKLTEEWREGKELTSAINEVELLKIHRLKVYQLLKKQKTKNQRVHKPRFLNNEYSIELECKLPLNWKWDVVDNLFDVNIGATPSRKRSEYWNGSFSWVSSGEVRNNIIYETKETITTQGIENSSVKIYPKGTVLIAMIGEGKTRGQCSLLGIDAGSNQNVAALRINEDFTNSKYIWYLFQERYQKTRDGGRGGNQPALNGLKIGKISLPIPPLQEQTEIVRQVEHLFSIADRIEAQYEELKDKIDVLPQAILAKAFRGELVEQLPTDGDARELLKEIQALKASMKKTTRGKRK